MDAFYHLLLAFSFHFVERCKEGAVSLTDQETYSEYLNSTGYVQVTSGILEVCVNGTNLQICNSSDVDPDLADAVCYYLGYDG